MRLWTLKSQDDLATQVAELEAKLAKAQVRINDLLLEKFQLEASLETANQFHGVSARETALKLLNEWKTEDCGDHAWETPLAA
jgi:hypothetical protein